MIHKLNYKPFTLCIDSPTIFKVYGDNKNGGFNHDERTENGNYC